MLSVFRRGPSRSLTLGVLVLAVSGCGGSGRVSGEVRLNGVPLSSGWVTLTYTDGKHSPVSGAIGSDGSYRIDGCPTGDVRVTVRPTHTQVKTAKEKKQPALPARYADPDKTDIKTTVTGGSQRLDIELTP